jgi:hypothetical protein
LIDGYKETKKRVKMKQDDRQTKIRPGLYYFYAAGIVTGRRIKQKKIQ